MRSNELGIGVDVDAVHEGEIEQDPSVDARQARDGMSSAADRQQQALLAGEVDRVDHVGSAGGLHHHGRTIAVHGVVHRTDGVITRITRRKNRASDGRPEVVEKVLVDVGLAAIEHHSLDCHGPSQSVRKRPASPRRSPVTLVSVYCGGGLRLLGGTMPTAR